MEASARSALLSTLMQGIWPRIEANRGLELAAGILASSISITAWVFRLILANSLLALRMFPGYEEIVIIECSLQVPV